MCTQGDCAYSAREDRRRSVMASRRCRSCSARRDRRRALLGCGHTPHPPIYPFSAPPKRGPWWWCRSCGGARVGAAIGAGDIEPRQRDHVNSSLIAEYRAIEFVRRLIDDGALKPAPDRRIPPHQRHRIDLGFIRQEVSASSRLNTDFGFLRDACPPAAARTAGFSTSTLTTSGAQHARSARGRCAPSGTKRCRPAPIC